MDKEKLEATIIDYIDGQLSEEDRLKLEKQLMENPEERLLYEQLHEVINAIDRSEDFEPGTWLKTGFDKILQVEINGQKPTRTIFLQPVIYRAAAAILLVVSGIGIGYWINKNQEQQKQIAALQKEVAETKHLMMAMLDNQQSASQRMIGTSVAMKMEKADDDIVNALVKTMNEDPNTNVRLAAFEALMNFQEEPAVRKALIESLSIQKDPSVQITLIRFMIKMKEKEVVRQLQQIVDDTGTLKAVKDEAYSGILKLS